MKSKFRYVLLFLLAGLIIAQVVLFMPSMVEEDSPGSKPLDLAAVIAEEGLDESVTLAPGIPSGKIPEYTVNQFHYVSSVGEQKQWKLLAKKAYLFNEKKLVHARSITAHIYNPNGEITEVVGKEAKYFMNQKDLEVFGAVTTRFPDGFLLHSEYLRYFPDKRIIEIPLKYRVLGEGDEQNQQRISFESDGLNYKMTDSLVKLQRNVVMTLTRPADTTTIESDEALIHRDTKVTDFFMYPSRPLKERFVRITQQNMYARARRATMSYGDFNAVLNYLVAYEDVLIKEKNKADSLRYGTGGIAEFNNKNNRIVLKEYPQVYQDEDTVTGDIIIVHRDTDIVEVEQSNAFSAGTNANTTETTEPEDP